MGYVYCATCNNDQHVCSLCMKTWRVTNRSMHVQRRSNGGCGATIKHNRIACPTHTPAIARCDFCAKETLAEKSMYGKPHPPKGWAYPEVGPRKHGLACSDCWARLQVALDALWANGFTEAFDVIESRACAFAFQLGQTLDHQAQFWKRWLELMSPDCVTSSAPQSPAVVITNIQGGGSVLLVGTRMEVSAEWQDAAGRWRQGPIDWTTCGPTVPTRVRVP